MKIHGAGCVYTRIYTRYYKRFRDSVLNLARRTLPCGKILLNYDNYLSILIHPNPGSLTTTHTGMLITTY